MYDSPRLSGCLGLELLTSATVVPPLSPPRSRPAPGAPRLHKEGVLPSP